ncbi:MAG: glycosyltransferase [bacterium]|nr:glycosyltransferase [bacterium]
MRIALVHDYLNQYGGAERVLEALALMFPEAPIYTLLYDEASTFGRFRGRVKGTSFLDYPFVSRRHRLFIPLLPLAASSLRIPDEYDLIISSTAGYAKGIAYGRAKHIAYCHTPLRYAWEPDYIISKFSARGGFASGGQIPNSKFNAPMRLALAPLLWYLRRWDYRAGQKPDVLLANSRFIADKIRRYYGREAEVVYPPVDTSVFYPNPAVSRNERYIAAGRMLHYKRFDLVVDAFNKLGLPLTIVGNGPELGKLRAMAKSNISFLPFESDAGALRRIYSSAQALIFPQVEDFGLVAAEALACGTPVIAYDAGGAKEIMEAGRNGILFPEQTPASLVTAVRRFETLRFDPKTVAASARRFAKEEFARSIRAAVDRVVGR